MLTALLDQTLSPAAHCWSVPLRATSCHFVGLYLQPSSSATIPTAIDLISSSRRDPLPPRRCKKPKLTPKLDSLFDPSESDSESEAAVYSVCSSVASDQTKPFCPTSPPRVIATVATLEEQLESATPAKLKLLCGKFAARSASFEVLAEEYKAQAQSQINNKLDKLELELTDRLEQTERKLTRALTLLTEAHDRISHLCETVQSFEQDQGLDPDQEY